MEVEQQPLRNYGDQKTLVGKRLFGVCSKEDKEKQEQELLHELDSLGAELYAESASEKLSYYLENKKVDSDQYYESKYKPFENDSANNEEAYQKLMAYAKVQEYGSNFKTTVYDPQQVVLTPDELLDKILIKSVNKSFNFPSRTPSSQNISTTSELKQGFSAPFKPPLPYPSKY